MGRDLRCVGCGAGELQAVIDYVQSHRVCTRCGVVSRDLIPPQSDGFHASERSTIASAAIGSTRSCDERTRNLARFSQRTRTPLERQSIKMQLVVQALAERMTLSLRIVEETNRVVLHVRRAYRRKVKKDELMAASCIIIACRRLGFPRSFADVACACDCVSTKELGRTFKTLSRAIGGNNAHEELRLMVPRFAALAGFVGGDVLLSEHIAAAAMQYGVVPGGHPLSIIAGSLLFVAQLRVAKAINCEHVSLAVGVATTTTIKAYRALQASAERILTTRVRRKFGVGSVPIDPSRCTRSSKPPSTSRKRSRDLPAPRVQSPTPTAPPYGAPRRGP